MKNTTEIKNQDKNIGRTEIKKRNSAVVGMALPLALSTIMVKVLGVFYKVPLTYMLGEVGMGYFNSAYTIYGFFYILCSSGVAKGVTILTTERTDVKAVYRTALGLFFAIGAAFTVGFAMLSPLMASMIGSKKSLFSLLLIAPSLVLIALCGVMRGYLTGRLRLAPIAISQLIEAVSKLVLGILFAKLGVDLEMPIEFVCAFSILGITLGSLFALIYLYVSCISSLRSEKTGQSTSRRIILSRLLRICIPISLTSSVVSLGNIFDLAIIMRRLQFCGLSETEAALLYGNYSTLAVPMLNLVVALLSPLTVALLPLISGAYSRGDGVTADATVDIRERNTAAHRNNSVVLQRTGEKEIVKHTASTLRLCAFITLPCAVAFLLYGGEILDILFSYSAATRGARLLRLLSPAACLLPALTILNTVHEGMKDVRTPMVSLLVGSVVKILLTCIFVGGEMGIGGAAVSTVLSYVVSLFISHATLIKKGIRLPFLSLYALPLLCSICSFIPVYRMLYMPLGAGLLRGVICMALSSLIYLLLYMSIMCIAVRKQKARQIQQKSFAGEND